MQASHGEIERRLTYTFGSEYQDLDNRPQIIPNLVQNSYYCIGGEAGHEGIDEYCPRGTKLLCVCLVTEQHPIAERNRG